jgi:hypothetical protein
MPGRQLLFVFWRHQVAAPESRRLGVPDMENGRRMGSDEEARPGFVGALPEVRFQGACRAERL